MSRCSGLSGTKRLDSAGGRNVYLPAKPGTSHRDLSQLSPKAFVETLAAGLPLIWNNASSLSEEAAQLERLGRHRSAGILNSFAEEEAAKVLLLFDVLRCPNSLSNRRGQLIGQLDNHIGKGIYVRYYRTSPGDLTEVKRIVDSERKEFWREGEYGEYILPNSITTSREERLYVSYIRKDDGTYEWSAPRDPLFHFSELSRSGVLRVAGALKDAGLFEHDTLRVARDYWQKFHFEDLGDDPLADKMETNVHWRDLTQMNYGMLHILAEQGYSVPA
jgi:AbiV family abortive infection protein